MATLDPDGPAMSAGEITYKDQAGRTRRFQDGEYSHLDSMSRVQLKVLDVYLLELQEQVRDRVYARSVTERNRNAVA